MTEKLTHGSATWVLGGSALALVWFVGCGSTADPGAAQNAGGASVAALGSSGQADASSGGSGAGASAGTSGASSSAATAGNGGATTTANGGSSANTSGGAATANGGTATASGGAAMTANSGATNTSGAAGVGGGTAHAGSAGTSAGCSGVFCEDFESGSLSPAVWDSQTSGGQTVTVQSAVTAHGKYAAQFHAKPNIVSYDFIITKNAPAALRGHHFGRAYFNVTPKPPAEHTGFLFAGTPGFPKLKYLEVAGIGTAWQLTYVDLIGGGESYASGGNAPDARWVCLEWEFNDTPDQVTVFVDGVQSYSRASITFMNQSTGLVGGFSDFGFGYYAWHPATYAFDIYYDDIVLDTKRVGCLGQ